MTPLEAMASGAPFVASDAGYYRAFSGEGAAGLVVEDAAQAAVKVGRLLNDPARLAVMSSAAVARARAEYSVEQEAAGIRSVYEALWQRG